MIEVVLKNSSLKKKNRNRCGEEIDAFVILLHLSNKLIPERIEHRKSEIGHLNCIYICPEYVLEYIGLLASINIVSEICRDAFIVSFADFWSSVDLPHLQNIKL